jgi:hypothetical protein
MIFLCLKNKYSLDVQNFLEACCQIPQVAKFGLRLQLLLFPTQRLLWNVLKPLTCVPTAHHNGRKSLSVLIFCLLSMFVNILLIKGQAYVCSIPQQCVRTKYFWISLPTINCVHMSHKGPVQAFSQKGVQASWDFKGFPEEVFSTPPLPPFIVDVSVYQNWTPSFRTLAKSLARSY